MSQSVVFFGSGPVAARSLALLARHTTIEAVITKPTTLSEMTAVSPKDTPVYTVTSKTELYDLISSTPFTSTLAVLIDFGIIVSQMVIDSFEYGIINSHFSVLPQWRGADPISFAVLSGQKTTGVSLMLIDQGMDTGKVLVTKSIKVSDKETTPSLTNKLIDLSNDLLKEYIPLYMSGKAVPRSQSHPDRATYSRKLTKDDGILDWSKPAVELEREIRAFIEWPKSRTTLGSKEVIITAAHASAKDEPGTPGQLLMPDKDSLGIITAQGVLWIDSLKPAGKKEMPIRAFLAGYRQLLS